MQKLISIIRSQSITHSNNYNKSDSYLSLEKLLYLQNYFLDVSCEAGHTYYKVPKKDVLNASREIFVCKNV